MTDPKPTREIVIVETTHDGMRESWNPTDEEMLEMGFARVGNGTVAALTEPPKVSDLVVPTNGHAEEGKP